MNNEKEIYYAITFNDPAEVKNLVTHQNVNSKIRDGFPIHYAVFKNNYTITNYLIDIGADVNARFEDGSTALITAAENGFLDICRLLINNKANVNEVDNYGNDALVKAVLYGHTGVIKMLLENGADINNINVKGKTAIDLADEMNVPEITNLLKAGKKHDSE